MLRKTGLRDYVIQAVDDADFFRQAKELCFNGVEPGPTRGQLSDPAKTRLGSLKKAADETGLEIPSLSLNHHNHGGLGSSDSKIRQAAEDDIRRCFEWAGLLGAKIFLIPFFGAGSLQDEDDRQRAVDHFKVLCEEAALLGVSLAYEGDLCGEDILEMAGKIDSPAFGCYMDLANPLLYGLNPVEELGKLRGLIRSVHIKDFKEQLGDCRPGQGRVPLKDCAERLQELKYDGWLILETPPALAEVVAGDFDFVKQVFGS